MSIRITLSTHFAKFTMLGTFIQSSSIKQIVHEMFDFDALDLLDLDDFDGKSFRFTGLQMESDRHLSI